MPKGSPPSGRSANRNLSATDRPISQRPSFDPNSRLPRHPNPLRDVVANERGEKGGRAPDGLAADGRKPLLGVRFVDDAIALGAEPGYHRAGGTGWRHD